MPSIMRPMKYLPVRRWRRSEQVRSFIALDAGGTITKYTLKPGHDKQFIGDMERFEESPPAGWVYHTIFRSTTNPNEIWMSVVFENAAAYKKNADSPEMEREYH